MALNHRSFVAQLKVDRAVLGVVVVLMNITAWTALFAAPTNSVVIRDIDLSKSFETRTAWHFTAAQGPPIEDPILEDGQTEPGTIKFCLHAQSSTACDPQLSSTAHTTADEYSDFHFLRTFQIVWPRGASDRPLLFIQAASLFSGDGDQIITTQVLAYRQSENRFVRVYDRRTGKNNNQETRYLAAGHLKGEIVSVEPTANAPFGFWVSVSAFSSHGTYQELVRFRSATRYGDGNSLAVIDSEMPNIERRLGFWKLGAPLPLPPGPCLDPHLIRMELWCS